MSKSKIIKTTILVGMFSTAIAENNNKISIDKNIDWDDVLNKFKEYEKNILQKCSKSIVEIYGTKEEKVNLDGFIFDNSDFFDAFNFFNDESSKKEEHLMGIKTQEIKTNGFLIDGEGSILTNYSDIKGFKNVKVKIGEKEYGVNNINYDEYSDLALLKITASNLDFLLLEEHKDINDHKKVYCIGNKENCYLKTSLVADNKKKEKSETAKNKKKWRCFSKKKKKIEEKKDNRKYSEKSVFENLSTRDIKGCWGLINLKGEIVGIKVKKGKFYKNKVNNFSSVVPSCEIISIVKQLKKGEKVKYCLEGLTLIENNKDLAKEKMLKIQYGCFISDLNDKMQKVGFKKNDVIIELNGYFIDNLNSLFEVFNVVKNQNLVFTINRENKNIEIKVNFGVLSDIKLEFSDYEIKTKDFIFSYKDKDTVELKCINNLVPDLKTPLIVSTLDHMEIENIQDIIGLIKKRLINKNKTNEISFLVEGFFPNNKEIKKVFGINIS